MEYKLISMDFDGTLLTSDKKVSKRNKDILIKLKRENYIIVGITARNLSSVKNVCDINMFNYLILNNGAYVYDVENDRTTTISNINTKIAIEITNYFKKDSYQIDYCALNNYYIYLNEKIDNRSFFKKIKNLDEIEEKIVRMNIFLKQNKENKKHIEYVKNNFSDLEAIEMSDTDNNTDVKWIVLNSKGTNKLETLKNLCSKINIDINEVIFFGDGGNDISIISQVGLGVAMGNALKEVKKEAKEITLSNNEDGIARFLEKIIMN